MLESGDLRKGLKLEIDGEPYIIVHGANYYRDDLLKRLSVEKEILTSISGYSSVFTNDEIIDSMLMSYSGLINKKIVKLT